MRALQVHLLRRLAKELTSRIRSLRFFENVRMLQRAQQEGGAGPSRGRISPAVSFFARASAPGKPGLLQERERVCVCVPDRGK